MVFAGCGCRAYDRAAIKFRGVEADINFSLEDYEEDLKQVLRLFCHIFLRLKMIASGFNHPVVVF